MRKVLENQDNLTIKQAEICELVYEDYYDDHNMTYILRDRKDYKEVEGSDKCIVSLIDKSNGQLVIDTIADARLRGGAGDATHVMNLFCGLHEKVGLTLKVNNF